MTILSRNQFMFAPRLQLKHSRPIFNPCYSDIQTYHGNEQVAFTSLVFDLVGSNGLTLIEKNKEVIVNELKQLLQKLCLSTMTQRKRNGNVAEYCCQRCFTIFPTGRHGDLFSKHPCNDDPTSERCATSGLIPISNPQFKDYFESLVKKLDPQQQEIALHVHANQNHIFLFGPGGKGKSFLMNVLKLYFIQEYSYDQVC